MANGRALAAFRERFQGQVLLPGDPGCERARAAWNATADAHPAVVARCAGHSYPGSRPANGGIVIDLAAMAGVRVDPARRVAAAPAVAADPAAEGEAADPGVGDVLEGPAVDRSGRVRRRPHRRAGGRRPGPDCGVGLLSLGGAFRVPEDATAFSGRDAMAALMRRWDPADVLRRNQNIRPWRPGLPVRASRRRERPPGRCRPGRCPPAPARAGRDATRRR